MTYTRANGVLQSNGVLQGPESISAAQALREERLAKSQWPFPWSFPPPGAIRVTAGANALGTLVVPTVVAGLTQGLAYTVDEGFQFALEAIVVEYLDAGVAGLWNPGDMLWSLTLNQPVGVTTFQGSPIQGLSSVDVPLGTLQIPWSLFCPDIFQPNDCIRSVFTNVALHDSAPNYLKTLLLGWKWPVA
jgi:hypothetical protein